MFKVAICDDDLRVGIYIEGIILKYSKVIGESIEVEVYESGEKLYRVLKEEKCYQLIFLDINLGKMSGIDIGKKIRDELDNQSVQIVYISAANVNYLELFEIRPMNFFTKPIREENVIESIQKCMKLVGWDKESFSYKIGHCTHKAILQDIIYFESMARKVKMVMVQEQIEFYGKIEEIVQELEQYHFLNIHRSYLVNVNYIEYYKYDEVILKNGETLPISQPKRKKIRRMQLKQLKKALKNTPSRQSECGAKQKMTDEQ